MMKLEDYIAKYGEVEGLRRWKKSERNKRWYQTHREEQLESVKRYRQEHREEVLEHKRQYRKSHPEKHREYTRRWREANPEKNREANRQYYRANKEYYCQYQKENRDKANERNRRWVQSHPMKYRANSLLQAYRQNDLKYNRGECTLTAKWIVNNIFNRSCLYCGEEDWKTLGCDRIDNSLPHTPQNVVCSCEKCNKKRHTKDFLEFAYSMGAKDSDGLIIK